MQAGPAGAEAKTELQACNPSPAQQQLDPDTKAPESACVLGQRFEHIATHRRDPRVCGTACGTGLPSDHQLGGESGKEAKTRRPFRTPQPAGLLASGEVNAPWANKQSCCAGVVFVPSLHSPKSTIHRGRTAWEDWDTQLGTRGLRKQGPGLLW